MPAEMLHTMHSFIDDMLSDVDAKVAAQQGNELGRRAAVSEPGSDSYSWDSLELDRLFSELGPSSVSGGGSSSVSGGGPSSVSGGGPSSVSGGGSSSVSGGGSSSVSGGGSSSVSGGGSSSVSSGGSSSGLGSDSSERADLRDSEMVLDELLRDLDSVGTAAATEPGAGASRGNKRDSGRGASSAMSRSDSGWGPSNERERSKKWDNKAAVPVGRHGDGDGAGAATGLELFPAQDGMRGVDGGEDGGEDEDWESFLTEAFGPSSSAAPPRAATGSARAAPKVSNSPAQTSKEDDTDSKSSADAETPTRAWKRAAPASASTSASARPSRARGDTSIAGAPQPQMADFASFQDYLDALVSFQQKGDSSSINFDSGGSTNRGKGTETIPAAPSGNVSKCLAATSSAADDGSSTSREGRESGVGRKGDDLDGLASLPVRNLKALLRAKGLIQSGRKVELIERLTVSEAVGGRQQ